MKYLICPHCGGKLRSETLGWICEKCRRICSTATVNERDD